MIKKQQLPILVFFILLILSTLWMVAAYGTMTGFERTSTLYYRQVARIALAVTSVGGLFLLPKTKVFPRIPIALLISLGYLLFWGVFMVLNAKSDHDVSTYIWEIFPNEERLIPSLPGSVAHKTSLNFVLEFGVIVLFFFAIARSVQTGAWRWIVMIFALCSLFVAIVGIGHKVLGMKEVWGVEGGDTPTNFFAPYINLANASSMMNLGIVILMGLALKSQRTKGIQSEFFGWVLASGVVAAGIVAAASKAAVLILFIQFILFLILEAGTIKAALRQRRGGACLTLEKKFVIGAIALIFAALGLLSAQYLYKRVDEFVKAIEEKGEAATITGRVSIIKLTLETSFDEKEPIWAGFGPGTFRHVIHHYMNKQHAELITSGKRWDQTHCDPAQTIFEWGYLGAIAWFVIGIGAVVRGIWLLGSGRIPDDYIHMIRGVVISLIGLGIHSCFDFPLSLFSIHVVAVGYCAVLWTIFREPGEGEDLA